MHDRGALHTRNDSRKLAPEVEVPVSTRPPRSRWEHKARDLAQPLGLFSVLDASVKRCLGSILSIERSHAGE